MLCPLALVVLVGCGDVSSDGDPAFSGPTTAPGGETMTSVATTNTDEGEQETADDGVCDDGETRPCYEGPEGTVNVGTCAEGFETCSGGRWGSCEEQVLPVTIEMCDGEDDDCDGTPDQNCQCISGESRECFSGPDGSADVGTCRAGEEACEGGLWTGTCVGERPPVEETCDFLDNDCDGVRDNIVGEDCNTGEQGICRDGTEVCVNGNRVCMRDNEPEPDELCDNNLDDDCNGMVNDGC